MKTCPHCGSASRRSDTNYGPFQCGSFNNGLAQIIQTDACNIIAGLRADLGLYAERAARRIFKRLDTDIRDRCGLKHVWSGINEDIMRDNIQVNWEQIITEEIVDLTKPELDEARR